RQPGLSHDYRQRAELGAAHAARLAHRRFHRRPERVLCLGEEVAQAALLAPEAFAWLCRFGHGALLSYIKGLTSQESLVYQVLDINTLPKDTAMTQVFSATDLDSIIDEHFAAELRGDVDATIATFTDDVEHDVVGRPTVSHGRAEAAAFYRNL